MVNLLLVIWGVLGGVVGLVWLRAPGLYGCGLAACMLLSSRKLSTKGTNLDTNKEPKGNQKGNQKETKRETKREPKGNQKETNRKGEEEEEEEEETTQMLHLGAIW